MRAQRTTRCCARPWNGWCGCGTSRPPRTSSRPSRPGWPKARPQRAAWAEATRLWESFEPARAQVQAMRQRDRALSRRDLLRGAGRADACGCRRLDAAGTGRTHWHGPRRDPQADAGGRHPDHPGGKIDAGGPDRRRPADPASGRRLLRAAPAQRHSPVASRCRGRRDQLRHRDLRPGSLARACNPGRGAGMRCCCARPAIVRHGRWTQAGAPLSTPTE